jgi:hypothetical protein
MRRLCDDLLDAHSFLYHVPFAEADNLFARTVLQGTKVRYLRFQPRVHLSLAKFSRFVPTRYHALIMGMRCGVVKECIPYFVKNLDFLTGLGLAVPSHDEYLASLAHASTRSAGLDHLLVPSGCMDEYRLDLYRAEVYGFLRDALPDDVLM